MGDHKGRTLPNGSLTNAPSKLNKLQGRTLVVAPDVKRETDVAGQFTDEAIFVTVSQQLSAAKLPKF